MRHFGTLFLLLVAIAASAEVKSITLGIDVNSPYGLGEPWAIIRAGLLRLDYVESVSAVPDRQKRTGELRTKDGRLPDVEALAQAIREIGAGASLRDVEATVAGQLEQQGESVVLRLSKTAEVLMLEPLPQARPEWKPQARVEATGRLVKGASGARLQVREFRIQEN